MQTTEGTTSPHVGKKKKRRNKSKKNSPAATNETPLKDQIDDGEATEQPELKRSHSDDDQESGSERPVKKKKKKNKPLPTEPGKKGAKSIRQMKREKHAARMADAVSVAKDALKNQCLHYLSQWKHDRTNWKFMKVKQQWLFKHMFSKQHIPKDSWPTFLEYFSSAQGNIKNILLEEANKVIAKMDAFLEKEHEEDLTDEQKARNSAEKPDKVSYKRARDIIQHLE